ncbi:hypothetical protein RZS08_44720, partial [Arthrospira platensis SPKY1]|nr:hypothetical protein [Arthrospira platensis SPKY1]
PPTGRIPTRPPTVDAGVSFAGRTPPGVSGGTDFGLSRRPSPNDTPPMATTYPPHEMPPPPGSGSCCVWLVPLTIDLVATGGRATAPEVTGACCASCAAGEACESDAEGVGHGA